MTDDDLVAFLRRLEALDRNARLKMRLTLVAALGVPLSIIAGVLLLILAGGR